MSRAPLADIRVARRRAVRRRSLGDAPARRPRRRGDQDRGPERRRRRRAVRAPVPGGRELAVLRDLQPQQAQRLARSSPSRRRGRCSRTSCASADAVFSNLSGDQPAKLGLRHGDLEHVNPTIVCCSLSGFGMTGPRAREGAYDYTVQGLAGWQSVTGDPGRAADQERALARRFLRRLRRCDRDPRRSLARAPRRRRRRLSTSRSSRRRSRELTYLGTWVGTHDYLPVRRAELRPPVDRSVPELRDERTAGSSSPARSRRSGNGSATRSTGPTCSPTSATRASPCATHREELLAMLEPIFRSRPAADWIEVARGRGGSVRAVNDDREALADPQVEARGAVVEIPHPVLGTIRQVATPLRLDGVRATNRASAPSGASTPRRCSANSAATTRRARSPGSRATASSASAPFRARRRVERSSGAAVSWRTSRSAMSSAADSGARLPKPTTPGSRCSR